MGAILELAGPSGSTGAAEGTRAAQTQPCAPAASCFLGRESSSSEALLIPHGQPGCTAGKRCHIPVPDRPRVPALCHGFKMNKMGIKGHKLNPDQGSEMLGKGLQASQI